MKIEVNGIEILTVTETQKKVMAYGKSLEAVEQEILSDLKWILEHKLERCAERMKNEWTDKLVKDGMKSLPLKKEKFAEEVFKHKDYKDRSAREAAEESKRLNKNLEEAASRILGEK